MRILFISSQFPPEPGGGGAYTQYLSHALCDVAGVRSKCDVIVLTSCDGPPKIERLLPNLEIHRGSFSRNGKVPYQAAVTHGLSVCASFRPQVIHGQHFDGAYVATQLKAAYPRVAACVTFHKSPSGARVRGQQRTDPQMTAVLSYLPAVDKIITTCLVYRKVVLPAMIVITGFLALLAEARMLAPSFDMFSIADPVAQGVVGLAFALVAAIIFHFVLECLYSAETSSAKKIVAYTVGGFAVIWLVFFGIVRARQAVFAAQMGENPLARFLESLPFLTTIVFASATLIFPVAAGVAITYGIQGFRKWLDFFRAERNYRKTLSRLVETEKIIASERNLLAHALDELTAEEKQLRHTYLVHHDRGATMGARRTPFWMVHAKAIAAAALVFGVGLLVGLSVPSLLALSLATGIATWLYAYRARIHPTPAQYFRQRNVVFQVIDETDARLPDQEKEAS